MIDPKAFRKIMGRFATGVTVVTTRTAGGEVFHGMTVNSLASVSLNPPLVLFCAEHHTRTLEMIVESGVYAVNMLTEDQRPLSDRFAGFTEAEGDRFQGLEYSLARHSGCPVFPNNLATLDCRLVADYPGGDHTILLARVEEMSGGDGRPLLFYSSSYPRLE